MDKKKIKYMNSFLENLIDNYKDNMIKAVTSLITSNRSITIDIRHKELGDLTIRLSGSTTSLGHELEIVYNEEKGKTLLNEQIIYFLKTNDFDFSLSLIESYREVNTK